MPDRGPWNASVSSFSSAPEGARCSRKRYFTPSMPASSTGGASSPAAAFTTGGASRPISQPTPRRYRSPMAAANGRTGALPQVAEGPRQAASREFETTIRSSDTEYGGAGSPASGEEPFRALSSSARRPGCTRAITIGTSTPAPADAAQKTTSSPSSEVTDWMRSTICLQLQPVSRVPPGAERRVLGRLLPGRAERPADRASEIRDGAVDQRARQADTRAVPSWCAARPG